MFIETVHAASIIPDFSEAQDFGYFIKNIYNLSIGLVGLAVFVQFIRAGLEYMLAAGNVGKVENAKEYMTNAILGAVLLLSAYLILNVINPDLLNVNLFNKEYLVKELGKDFKVPSLTPVPGRAGLGPNPVIKTSEIEKTFAASSIALDSGVKIEGLRRDTVQSIAVIKEKCGCPIRIVEGTEEFPFGDKITIESPGTGDSKLRDFFTTNYTKNGATWRGPGLLIEGKAIGNNFTITFTGSLE